MQSHARYCACMPIVTRNPISGERLRELREERDWSQADLAQACTQAGQSVTQAQISRLEQGRNQPFMPLLRTLARVLDVSVADLLLRTAERAS